MNSLKKVRLGSQGLMVSELGLGCMGMTTLAGADIYGKAVETESIHTIHSALELGCNFLDTADLYGPFLNEKLIAKAIKGKRDRYTLATKFGYEINDAGQLTWKICGKKDYVRRAVELSLKHLETDYIDLYYLHRVDPNTPIEETVGAMADLVKEGKVGYLGLSEVSGATLRRAHAVHPITAVQSEYSIFERSIEDGGIIDTLRELGISLVAYSPLGRGFLTGGLKTPNDLHEGDFRKNMPRFQGEQFFKNIELVKAIEAMAANKGVTPSQLAIAWVLAKGHVAIPGTKRVKYLEQNIEAASIPMTDRDLRELEAIVPPGTITGDRYDAVSMAGVNL